LEKRNNRKKLRIVVLGIRGFPDVQGGIEKHCQELYPRLIDYNLDITVLARKGYVKGHPFSYKGVKIVPLCAPKSKYLEAICHTALGIFWLAKRRLDFDILHLHAIGPSLMAYPARRLGFRLVITHHGPDYARKKWGTTAKIILRLGERLGAKYADLIIVVSRHIQRLLFEKYESIAVYIPNGVNIDKGSPPGGTLMDFALEKGKYFLTVGRLVPEKGFLDLLDAYAGLSTDWKLAIVGAADHNDGYSNTLRRRADQIEGVVMTGFQADEALSELYSHAGLFVLPSYHEGLPIVALEAMSHKLPMLVSDIPANKEFASDEEVFPVGDIEALSERLRDFLENPSLLTSPKTLIQKIELLDRKFNWDDIADRTCKVYRAVARMPVRMGIDIPRNFGML